MRERQGRALANKMCGKCHAVGHSDQSAHVGAPAFRMLDDRIDPDSFMERLQEGLRQVTLTCQRLNLRATTRVC